MEKFYDHRSKKKMYSSNTCRQNILATERTYYMFLPKHRMPLFFMSEEKNFEIFQIKNKKCCSINELNKQTNKQSKHSLIIIIIILFWSSNVVYLKHFTHTHSVKSERKNISDFHFPFQKKRKIRNIIHRIAKKKFGHYFFFLQSFSIRKKKLIDIYVYLFISMLFFFTIFHKKYYTIQ